MRSGTTLLYRLLNNHPQITLLYEADAFAVGPLLWPSLRAGVWHQRLDFWNGTLRRHHIPASALPAQVRGPAEALECLGRAYAEQKPSVYIGSKTIHCSNRLAAMAQAFPAARFVVIWRPLAEIIDSLHRAGQTNAYLSPARRSRQLFQQYGELVEGVLALRRLQRSVHEVLYGELVVNPEISCRGLCDFLELPWSPSMLSTDPFSVSAVPAAPHHFRARSSPPERLQVPRSEIPAPAAAKLRSYERYWADRFAGQPVRMAPASALPPGPGLQHFRLQLWLDRLAYRVHRFLIFSKLFVYRFAPLTVLRWYRSGLRKADHSRER
jgi:hypothetical protein